MCVPSVTATPWEPRSAAVTVELEGVCAPIPRWEADVVTGVVTCSTDSTPAWAGNMRLNHQHTHRHTQRGRHTDEHTLTHTYMPAGAAAVNTAYRLLELF